MIRRLLSTAALLALTTAPALAYSVYPGCTVPPAMTGKTWWIDTLHGKTPAAWVTYFAANPTDTGIQGDVRHPWDNLQGVVSGRWGASIVVPGYPRPLLSSIPYNHATPTGRVDVADTLGNPPVHPGDTLMLMSGNYGDLSLGNFGLPTVNTDFVTIKAAPGQTPLLQTIGIGATNKWIFDGIKVSSTNGTNGNTKPLVAASGNAAFPTTDLLFLNMNVNSIDDGSAWTQAQWRANGRLGVDFVSAPGDGTNGMPYLTCVSMTGSHIHNTRDGAALVANNLLFDHNEIDHFGDDGLVYAASNLQITHIYIHDNFDAGDGNHEDGMQGQIGSLSPGVVFNKFSNILIDNNWVIRQTDPHLTFPTYLQGIDAFDEDWTNMTVTNNVIITSSCYSIQASSFHNSLIANNTGLEDGLVSSPGCTATINVGGKTHEGLDSSNVRVTNNLAEHFFIGDNAPASTVTFDHNVALNSYQPFVHWNGTAWTYTYPVGTDANGNVASKVAIPYASVFKIWDPAHLSYDLMLKAGSAAIGPGTFGSPLPTVDIRGVARSSPYAVGAYAAPASVSVTFSVK